MGRMKADPDSLSLSQQRYVEVIAGLIRDQGRARTTDVARRLGVRLPSVTEAVRRLAEVGLVGRRSRSEIVLSAVGAQIAEQLDGRQEALERFMVGVMGLPDEEAAEAACRIEHCVNREFADRLAAVAEYLVQRHPAALRGASEYMRTRLAAPAKAGGSDNRSRNRRRKS